MTLIKMIVTDEKGRTVIPEDKEKGMPVRDLTGTHGYFYRENTQKDPYHFWAVEMPNTAIPAHSVTMVTPMGGVQSGLYRYPKIGEQVLVACEGTEYYIMGYIPSALNPFNAEAENVEDVNRVFSQEGELLRYRNTAGSGEGSYSEIGFYKEEKAQWPLTAGGNDFSSIDVLTLDSTGNIRETAKNHHLQKAKRIEILADAPEVVDRKTNAVDKQGTLPLGEYPGDDASLHRGDIHIRAGNRVVIKADKEIRLQVGRTVLRIDDKGFNVVTKNVTGNYTNSYDTMLDMHPRKGIVLNGKNIKIQANQRFNAGDGLGGTFAATMGNLSISGRGVNIESCNSIEYGFFTLFQGLEYLINASSGGMAMGKADIKIADYIKFAEDNLISLAKIGKKAFGLWTKRKEIITQKEVEKHPPPFLPGQAPPAVGGSGSMYLPPDDPGGGSPAVGGSGSIDLPPDVPGGGSPALGGSGSIYLPPERED
ncbi:MAG: hypothetical protein LBB78_08830 [Spirochaetaceae bacterium]|jgi:hypothetical protein|nr:hypothetical protein [Spirochaetaceae bacterium]